MVVELRLPLIDGLVCKSQEGAPLVHKGCSDTAGPHIHAHIVAPGFISTGHCYPSTCGVKGQIFEGNPVDEGTTRRGTDPLMHLMEKTEGSTHPSQEKERHRSWGPSDPGGLHEGR